MSQNTDLHIAAIFRVNEDCDFAISCEPEAFKPLCRYGYARFLEDFGFCVPPEITYCLAKNDLYSLKFRKFGYNYSIFISNNKDAL